MPSPWHSHVVLWSICLRYLLLSAPECQDTGIGAFLNSFESRFFSQHMSKCFSRSSKVLKSIHETQRARDTRSRQYSKSIIFKLSLKSTSTQGKDYGNLASYNDQIGQNQWFSHTAATPHLLGLPLETRTQILVYLLAAEEFLADVPYLTEIRHDGGRDPWDCYCCFGTLDQAAGDDYDLCRRCRDANCRTCGQFRNDICFARPATMVTVTLIFSPGIVLAMHLTWITFRVSVRSVQERDGETWPQVSCSRLG